MEAFDGLADHEWLIRKAQDCRKLDNSAAKSWLLVARTLFPRNFIIQFEMYLLEKNGRFVRDAVKLLEDMLINFPQEPSLWAEVRAMSDALQTDVNDEKTTFLRELFNALPPGIQCSALLRTAEAAPDVLQQCKLMMLVIERHSSQVPDQGVKLVDSLLHAERVNHCTTPVNCYRKYLAYDVLPVLLRSNAVALNVTYNHIYHWLEKVIEFYVCYVTQEQLSQEQLSSPKLVTPSSLKSPGFVSPSTLKSPGIGLVAARQTVIPGLTEKESRIVDPWARLCQFLRLAGTHLRWNIDKIFLVENLDSQWHQISQMTSLLQSVEGDAAAVDSRFKQVLFCTAVLFFRSLHSYVTATDPLVFGGGNSSSFHAATLVMTESFRSGSDGSAIDNRSKKLKVESDVPVITVFSTSSSSSSTDIIQSFVTAFKCWSLLQSRSLSADFSRLYRHGSPQSWAWMNNFEVDALLYQGQYLECLTRLQAQSASRQDAAVFNHQKLRIALQMASCYYGLGDYSMSFHTVLYILHMLPDVSCASAGVSTVPPPVQTAAVQAAAVQTTPVQTAAANRSRQLQLISLAEADIFSHCIHSLISSYRNISAMTVVPDDNNLGNMLVLMQFDWPTYEQLFCETVQLIRRKGYFHWTSFFAYIVNIDMLEEFAYLQTPQGGNVNISLTSGSSMTPLQARTVTRGVNKGAAEDFKVAMERQLKRCDENIPRLLKGYIHDEKERLGKHVS